MTSPPTCWPSPSATCCSTLPSTSSWRCVQVHLLQFIELCKQKRTCCWSSFCVCVCVFSCGVVRGSSVWRWCVFSSRRSCGDSLCISSSRASAPGRLVPHTPTVVSQVRQLHWWTFYCVCVYHRKHQRSLVSTTGTASCFHSLTTTTFGTSSPPSPCSDPSWYDPVCLFVVLSRSCFWPLALSLRPICLFCMFMSGVEISWSSARWRDRTTDEGIRPEYTGFSSKMAALTSRDTQ